ncbi:hypothetical protein ANO11243_093650 [Dothideomycetidae sp. 11243]|nr:hypothetical protein ANO11243_093650 [fungal sp. No.11243]
MHDEQDSQYELTPTSGAAESVDIERGSFKDAAFRNNVVSSLSWNGLRVQVKDRKTGEQTAILDNASGVAFPGEMVALMGPSGSGKTTLLNYLAHRRIANGKETQSGQVMINGAQQSLSTMRQLSTYVEQEDALIGTLTAEETLDFAARLALPGLSRRETRARAAELIEAFGLKNARRVKVGTPLQKGLSGGQKRRVSVASQLITAPKVLFLDEPTSGLDSTASFEVMSYLKHAAKRYNLIVVASIHQPSTKTFELFDNICLLSQGQTCYFGPAPQLHRFFSFAELPVPLYSNPAEHALDLVNTDFIGPDGGADTVQRIKKAWQLSPYRKSLDKYLSDQNGDQAVLAAGHDLSGWRHVPRSVWVLVHRGFLKSVRDVVAYWIRLMMYTGSSGLAIMMGTVWVRLSANQDSIQPFINAIVQFFSSAFMSFMAVAYVPAYLEDRSAYVKERANGLYGPLAFNVANFLVGLPYLFMIVLIFSIIAYWLIAFQPTATAFFTWVGWLFLDLLAAESLVVFFASLFPNFVLSLALIAFVNGLWMSVGGFLVSPTILNVFWRYVFHYIDYQAYVFQGMMVNEFAHREYACDSQCHCSYQSALAPQCRIEGQAVLNSFGYSTGRSGKWVGILIAIILVYRVLAGVALWARKT